MGICEAESCPTGTSATQRCSGCKTTLYCGADCQRADWAVHKKACKINRMLYDTEHAEEEQSRSPPPKPRKTHCTGCNQRFREDDVEVDQECPDCGYITCESCSCSNSRGSCYCLNSNFGYKYCDREPKYYHVSSRSGKAYPGDYHPSKENGDELNPEDYPEDFEENSRECNNCGKVAKMLEKPYRY